MNDEAWNTGLQHVRINVPEFLEEFKLWMEKRESLTTDKEKSELAWKFVAENPNFPKALCYLVPVWKHFISGSDRLKLAQIAVYRSFLACKPELYKNYIYLCRCLFSNELRQEVISVNGIINISAIRVLRAVRSRDNIIHSIFSNAIVSLPIETANEVPITEFADAKFDIQHDFQSILLQFQDKPEFKMTIFYYKTNSLAEVAKEFDISRETARKKILSCLNQIRTVHNPNSELITSLTL